MNIYVMRHGTTVWNEIRRTQGHSQNMLSSSGKELVEKVAKIHAKTPIDIIYSSPLMRTMQTTNIMNKYHNAKVVKDNRLIEIGQGIFTGRLKSTYTELEQKQHTSRDKSCGMEDYPEVYARVKDFIDDILHTHPADNILIVTHSTPATLIDKILNQIPINFDIWNNFTEFNNAEIRKYHISE